MQELITVLYAAILVESLVNLVRTIKDKETDWKYWASLGVSIVASLIVTYNWDIDLFTILLGVGRVPFVGAVMTGFIIARGANFASDLIDLIKAATMKFASGQ